jgi:predicted RecB family nuclease
MFTPTNIADFLACPHLMTLDRDAARGEIKKPFFADSGVELLRDLGLKHEERYLRDLREVRGLQVVEIPANRDAAERTVEALRQGVDAVYQAVFQQGLWYGRADFLVRVDQPSKLGSWSYEVVETKLAWSTKARAVIQLCFYSDLLSVIQGCEPRWMHVVLGKTENSERLAVKQYIAYFRYLRREFEKIYCSDMTTYPEPVEHCYVCSWRSRCDARWRTDDYLCLVAGITRTQRKILTERGVNTVARLGALPLPPKPPVEGIGETALMRVREQARLQLEGRKAGKMVYELVTAIEPERGFAVLPPPSPGDIFLDFEGDPYALDGDGLEYLIGTVTLGQARSAGFQHAESADADLKAGAASGAPSARVPETEMLRPDYQAIWSFDAAGEKRAFERFTSGAMERRRQDPGMHIYHYAPYEPTAMKRLAGRYGTCIDELDELLRAGVFVDLYRVVRQSLRASVESYSIKNLEALYGFQRTLALRDANLALQAFESVLALGGGQAEAGALLNNIEGYNRDDCLSALELRNWLEDRRRDLEMSRGHAVPRPEPKAGEAGDEISAHVREVRALMGRLLDGLPADEIAWTLDQGARWLLAQMLEWHRREEKSSWWEYFRMCDLSDDELIEDRSAMGGLVYEGEQGREKRSIIHRYRFPKQEHAIDRAQDVRDPRTGGRPGTVVGIDERDNYVLIKRSCASPAPYPKALVPFEIVDSRVLRESLFRLGGWVADHRIEGPGSFRAARDLLLRRPPRLRNTSLAELRSSEASTVRVAERAVLALENSVLPIQGPPGSGKTFTGARMVVELVKQGRRVGITAVSHKVITKLLDEVCRAAGEYGVQLRAVQKLKDEDAAGCEDGMVTQVYDNGDVRDALARRKAQVAAGTSWLWAREDMASSVDVLMVDEAGQMSLAYVLAVSQAATSLVLLGDPQQLDQPQKGVHPPGADVSALAHVLGERATIRPEQGLFLEETWRMHPDVCAFISELFYDGLLLPRPENRTQRLNCQGPLDGTGLRYVPVGHTGNQNESAEEVARVAELIGGLLKSGATWTDKTGKTSILGLKDILVVAPYNAHVAALVGRLPAGARVGTVDKFQGQEAPVVFYSMATSSPEDAPRGMEFLYSLNRLNVAVSRAQCLAVIVASPALLKVQCRTPRQIELVNALCRYLEVA